MWTSLCLDLSNLRADRQTLTLGSSTLNPTPQPLSHRKCFIKSSRTSQLPHKSVHLFFIFTNIKNRLTDLCGNWLLRNNFVNTFFEITLLWARRCAAVFSVGGESRVGSNRPFHSPWFAPELAGIRPPAVQARGLGIHDLVRLWGLELGSCIVQSFRSRSPFIASPLWTPWVYSPTLHLQSRLSFWQVLGSLLGWWGVQGCSGVGFTVSVTVFRFRVSSLGFQIPGVGFRVIVPSSGCRF